MNIPSKEDIWSYYQVGISYKNTINLYETVKRNERFYAGDQWYGSPSADLPKPVINFIKRACQQKKASILTNKVAVLFSAPNWPGDVVTPELTAANQQNIASLANPQKPEGWENPFLVSEAECNKLNGMFEMDWKRLNMDYISQEGLLDACQSGDFILFSYWDDEAKTGQTAKGKTQVELVDNVNYYPGNPNERDPQPQPYIIIARREMVGNVKAEAKKNKVKQDDIDLISKDSDYQYQSGDMSQTELDDKSDGKIITLLYLYRNAETGTIWAQKQCKNATIRKAWDTLLKRYPVNVMNWEIRKNSCHGRAEITGLIPNQVAINKSVAYCILNVLLNSQPKVIYNKGYIQKWDNSFSKPIAVNGPVADVAKYLQPPSMAADAYNLPATILKNTLEMMGYNDAALGNVNPTNANAILAAIAQSKIPVQTIQNRYYNFVREFALNWLDMVLAYFKTSRWVEVIDNEGNKYPVDFDPSKVKDKIWSVNIDIGPAKDWTQDTALQMFNSMANSGHFDTVQYLKMLPNDAFNGKKEEILASIEQSQQQALAAQQKPQAMQPTQAPQMGGQ
jgi:hypothetical protein